VVVIAGWRSQFLAGAATFIARIVDPPIAFDKPKSLRHKRLAPMVGVRHRTCSGNGASRDTGSLPTELAMVSIF
jgi:hypothetical protein